MKYKASTHYMDVVPDWKDSSLLVEQEPPLLERQNITAWLDQVEAYAMDIYRACLEVQQSEKRHSQIKRDIENRSMITSLPANLCVSSLLLVHTKAARDCLKDPEGLSRRVAYITQLLVSPMSQKYALARSRVDNSGRDAAIRELRQLGVKRSVLAKEYGLTERTISRICNK